MGPTATISDDRSSIVVRLLADTTHTHPSDFILASHHRGRNGMMGHGVFSSLEAPHHVFSMIDDR